MALLSDLGFAVSGLPHGWELRTRLEAAYIDLTTVAMALDHAERTLVLLNPKTEAEHACKQESLALLRHATRILKGTAR